MLQKIFKSIIAWIFNDISKPETDEEIASIHQW
jgi:hypothetical protein